MKEHQLFCFSEKTTKIMQHQFLTMALDSANNITNALTSSSELICKHD